MHAAEWSESHTQTGVINYAHTCAAQSQCWSPSSLILTMDFIKIIFSKVYVTLHVKFYPFFELVPIELMAVENKVCV